MGLMIEVDTAFERKEKILQLVTDLEDKLKLILLDQPPSSDLTGVDRDSMSVLTDKTCDLVGCLGGIEERILEIINRIDL